MALQACRECGQMVSTEAASCPRCGVPRPTSPDGAPVVVAEKTIHEAHTHWIIYSWAFIFTLVFILYMVLPEPKELRWAFAILTSLAWLISWIIADSVEFLITNRRVATRTGIIQKNSQETLLEKVETVGVHQDIFGRLLNYGTVTVIGTGGSHDVFKRIAHPLELRRVLHEEIEKRKSYEA